MKVKNRNMIIAAFLAVFLVLAAIPIFIKPVHASTMSNQKSIPLLDSLKIDESIYKAKPGAWDWQKTSKDYIDYVFTLENTTMVKQKNSEERLSAYSSWLYPSQNMDIYFGETGNVSFVVPSYVGGPGAYDKTSGAEGINPMAAVLSASMLGYDMRYFVPDTKEAKERNQQPMDFVRQMVAFYEPTQKVVLNNPGMIIGGVNADGGSFWYEIMPSMEYVNIASMYIGKSKKVYDQSGELIKTLDASYDDYLLDTVYNTACGWLKVPKGVKKHGVSFNDLLSYNIILDKPVLGGSHDEPDAPAGLAYILYQAYCLFKNDTDPAKKAMAIEFLDGAKYCMDYLEQCKESPFYEMLLFYAPWIAAKMNAEQGTNYNVEKFISWPLGVSPDRQGWGILQDNWKDAKTGKAYNTAGLIGALDHRGGYMAFMNSILMGAGWLPTLKYDARFANSLGKWIYTAADSCTMFYPSSVRSENQTCEYWFKENSTAELPLDKMFGYEGLRAFNKNAAENSPACWGDPIEYNWLPDTDFGYGNNHTGYFGESINYTNVDRVLRVDINCLDFFGSKTYETNLFYNPYDQDKEIHIDLNNNERVYDTVTNAFISTNVISETKKSFTLPANASMVLVSLPTSGSIKTDASGNITYEDEFLSKISGNINMKNIVPDQEVKGNIDLGLEYYLPSQLEFEKITMSYVAVGGAPKEEVFSSIPSSITLDTTKMQNGVNELKLRLYYKNGLYDECARRVQVLNISDEVAVSYGSTKELADAWTVGNETLKSSAALQPSAYPSPNAFVANSSVDGDSVKLAITNGSTWGFASSPSYRLDLSRGPILEFEVTDLKPGSSWGCKMFVLGGFYWAYYVTADSSRTGKISINLLDGAKKAATAQTGEFTFTGINDVRILIGPCEVTDPYIKIKNFQIKYMFDYPFDEEPDSYEWGMNYTTGLMHMWSGSEAFGGANNAKIVYTQDATIQFAAAEGQSHGAVASKPIKIDLDKNPAMLCKLGGEESVYKIALKFAGDDANYVFYDSKTDQIENINILQGLSLHNENFNKKGSFDVRVVFILSDNKSVNLKEIITQYQLPSITQASVDNFMNWEKAETATVQEEADGVKISFPNSGTNGYGGGIYKNFEINVDSNAILNMNIAKLTGKWTLTANYLGVSGANSLIIFKSISSLKGNIEINLSEVLSKTFAAVSGKQALTLYINARGGSMTIDSFSVKYVPKEIKFDGTVHTSTNIATQVSSLQKPGSVYKDGTNAVIKEQNYGIGGIAVPISVMLKNEPTIIIDVNALSAKCQIVIEFNGIEYKLKEIDSAGKYTINIKDMLLGIAGAPNGEVLTANIGIYAVGNKATVALSCIQLMVKLDKVSNIAIQGTVISYSKLENADSYLLSITDFNNTSIITDHALTGLTYDFSTLNLEQGIYNVNVVGVSDKFLNSSAANKKFIVGDVDIVTLQPASNVRVDGQNILWDANSNASGYGITLIDSDTAKIIVNMVVEEPKFSLKEYGVFAYNFKIEIVVLGDDVATLSSQKVTKEYYHSRAAYFNYSEVAKFTPNENTGYVLLDKNNKHAIFEAKYEGDWGWGGFNSPSFEVDFDKNPLIFVDINKVYNCYYFYVLIDGTQYLLCDDTRANEDIYLNIRKIFEDRKYDMSVLSGKKSLVLRLGTTNSIFSDESRIEINNMSVVYLLEGYSEPPIELSVIDDPVLSVNGNVVSWEKVPNAQNYTINVYDKFGNLLYNTITADTSHDLTSLHELKTNTYKAEVIANATGYLSSAKISISVNVTEKPALIDDTGNKGCSGSFAKNLSIMLTLVGMSFIFIVKRK